MSQIAKALKQRGMERIPTHHFLISQAFSVNASVQDYVTYLQR